MSVRGESFPPFGNAMTCCNMSASGSHTTYFWGTSSMKRLRQVATSIAAFVVMVTVGFGVEPSFAASSNAPGVSATSINIGIVTSLTGAAAASFNGARQGADARFKLQNSEGGVDGRKINLIAADDTSSPQGAQSAVSELVNEKHVFGLIFISAVTGTAYHLAQQQGVPVIGYPADGPEWSQQPNTN